MADPAHVVSEIPWTALIVGGTTSLFGIIGAIAGLLTFVVRILKENAAKDREIGSLYKGKWKERVLGGRVGRVELERATRGTPSVAPPPVAGQEFDDDTAIIERIEREDAPFYAELGVPLRIQPGMPRAPRLEGLGGKQDYFDHELDQLERGHDTPTKVEPPLGGLGPSRPRKGR